MIVTALARLCSLHPPYRATKPMLRSSVTPAAQSSLALLQVGLLGSARELQRDLERIAARADSDSPAGLHYILQGACG